MKIINRVVLVMFFTAGLSFFGGNGAQAKEIKPAYHAYSSKECSLETAAPVPVSDMKIVAIPDIVFDAFMSTGNPLHRISQVCEFAVADKKEYNNAYPITLSMPHEETDFRPHLYYWQSQRKEWILLPTEMNRTTLAATADIHLPYAIVAVFEDMTDEYSGTASWYKDRRYPDGGATNLFPTGTKLRVTNLDNKKTTTVTITSTWTQKDSNRVIDLVSTAFKKIASLSAGLIPVRLERLD